MNTQTVTVDFSASQLETLIRACEDRMFWLRESRMSASLPYAEARNMRNALQFAQATLTKRETAR